MERKDPLKHATPMSKQVSELMQQACRLEKAEFKLIKLGGSRAKVKGTYFGEKFKGRCLSSTSEPGIQHVGVVVLLDGDFRMFGEKLERIVILAEDICGDWMKDYREMSIRKARK
jgi:hypothetical protein